MKECRCGFIGPEEKFMPRSKQCRTCRNRYAAAYARKRRAALKDPAVVDLPSVLRELHETRLLLAELHDRVREVWTSGAPYPQTALYDRVLAQLRRNGS